MYFHESVPEPLTIEERMMQDEGFKAFLAAQMADSSDPIHHLVQQLAGGTINQSVAIAPTQATTGMNEYLVCLINDTPFIKPKF